MSVFPQTRLFWRHSFKQPKFGPLDYRAAFFIFPFVLYIRVWTMMILAAILMMFMLLQKLHIEPDNILRWLRATIAGPVRSAHGVARKRPPVDYGFETDADVERAARKLIADRDARSSKKYKGRLPVRHALRPMERLPASKRLTRTRFG